MQKTHCDPSSRIAMTPSTTLDVGDLFHEDRSYGQGTKCREFVVYEVVRDPNGVPIQYRTVGMPRNGSLARAWQGTIAQTRIANSWMHQGEQLDKYFGKQIRKRRSP